MAKKILAAFTPVLCLAAQVAAQDGQHVENDCLHYLKNSVSVASTVLEDGIWIDDGVKLMEGGWKPGMDVVAVKYCITEWDTFGALQLIVGDGDHRIDLEKHGKPQDKNPKCF